MFVAVLGKMPLFFWGFFGSSSEPEPAGDVTSLESPLAPQFEAPFTGLKLSDRSEISDTQVNQSWQHGESFSTSRMLHLGGMASICEGAGGVERGQRERGS